MDEISKKNTKSIITLRTKQNEKSEKDLNKLSLQDLENLCKPLIEKHKDINLTHEELIIGVLKNK